MNSREKVKKIFDLKGDGNIGFWTGKPHVDTQRMYLEKLHLDDREELFKYFKDDCRWFKADGAYKQPEGKEAFDPWNGEKLTSLSQAGCLAECESIKEVDKISWPNTDYLDFSEIKTNLENFQDKSIFTGMWSPFFHVVSQYFGMENYFIKMYTDPGVVEAVTNHVVDYYCEANDKLFKTIGNKADTFFFGNDFGSQLDLLMSPESFKKFILPGIKRLISVAKKYDKKILLHSCGSIYKVIPLLIDAGVDAIHPLQAKAANMDADTLAREFKNDIAFVGGVDTQDLLVNGTPQDIKNEVYRIRELLGANLVVSGSHEALLPNVPLENVIAMAEAVRN